MPMNEELLRRITARPDVFGGKPLIRDLRVSVELVLGWADVGVRFQLVAASPETHYAVAVEEGLVGDEYKLATDCLCDEHSVERVAVQTRERPGAHTVLDGHG